MSPLTRRIAAAAAVCATVIGLAGCGNDSKTPSAVADGGVTKSKCTKEATAATDAAKAEVPLYLPDKTINMKSLAGKSLWLVAVVSNESSELLDEGFQAAAKAAGMTTHFAAANGQVTQMQKLVQEAVNAKAGGIVLFNVDPASVSGALDAAAAAGVTVVDFNNGSASDPVDKGVFAHVAFDMRADGKAMADWMLADSGCDADVALFQLPTYPISTEMAEGAAKEIDRLCADCGVTTSDMDIATIGTSLAPLVSTVLRRNPDIKYVDPGFDSFTGIAAPAIAQLNSGAKLIGHDGLPSTLKAMRSGSSSQVMTAAAPPMQYIGWALVDQLGRGMTGAQPAKWSIPSRLVDKTNIGTDDASIFPAYQNYQADFLKLWDLQ